VKQICRSQNKVQLPILLNGNGSPDFIKGGEILQTPSSLCMLAIVLHGLMALNREL
jgi:hypothetical protein